MSWLSFLGGDQQPAQIQQKQPVGHPYQPTMVGMQPYAPPGQPPPMPGSADAAMFGIENAGTLAMQTQAGVAPGTGPLAIDHMGQPTDVGTEAPKEGGGGMDWMQFLGRESQAPQLQFTQPRGMQQMGSPRAVIDPKTGLLRWDGGNNIA